MTCCIEAKRANFYKYASFSEKSMDLKIISKLNNQPYEPEEDDNNENKRYSR